jgi:maltose alpha-D-glucosyltransferase/alpha-amylase
LLQEFVSNEGDGWSYVLGELRRLLRAIRTDEVRQTESAHPRQFVVDQAGELLGNMRQLGNITGRLHVTLASEAEGQPFGPEMIQLEDVAAWRQAMEGRLDAVFSLLGTPSVLRILGLSRTSALALQQACRDRLAGLSLLARHRLLKIRQHGDYHLGQVLKRPGNDGFVVLDFEGEPARSLSERRSKTCVFKDLAGMLRSFSYAAEAVARDDGSLTKAERAMVSAWDQLASEAFLSGYEKLVRGSHAGLLPPPESMRELLCAFQVDKAVYELGYELNNRPTWVKIPLHALQTLCALPQGC